MKIINETNYKQIVEYLSEHDLVYLNIHYNGLYYTGAITDNPRIENAKFKIELGKEYMPKKTVDPVADLGWGAYTINIKREPQYTTQFKSEVELQMTAEALVEEVLPNVKQITVMKTKDPFTQRIKNIFTLEMDY